MEVPPSNEDSAAVTNVFRGSAWLVHDPTVVKEDSPITHNTIYLNRLVKPEVSPSECVYSR